MVAGLFLAARGPKSARFSSNMPQYGAKNQNGRQEEARYQATVCGNHESNPVGPICGNWDQIWPLWALRGPPGPPKGSFWAKTGPLWAPGGQEEAQYQAKVCGNHDSNPVGPICGNWDQIWPQVWPPELFSQLGPVLGQKGPLGPPVSTYKAPEWANMTYNYVSYPWVVF